MICLGRSRRLFRGLDSVSVIGALPLAIEVSLWWCGRLALRTDIVRMGFGLELVLWVDGAGSPECISSAMRYRRRTSNHM
jgi:hypothetical protein